MEDNKEQTIQISLAGQEQPKTDNPLKARGDFNYKYITGALFMNLFDKWIQISPRYKTGSGSRTTGDGTGAQQITGIGYYPRRIRVKAYVATDDGGFSDGTYDGTYICFERYFDGTNWQNTSETDKIIYARDASGNVSTATISAVNGDSFTLSWSAVAVNTSFIWEVSN